MPLKRREGASVGLLGPGPPCKSGPGQCPWHPGRFETPAAAPAPCKQGRAAALAAALHAQPHCPGCLLRRPSAIPTGSVPCAAWRLAQKEEEARCGAARQHTAEARGGEATYGGGKRRRGNIRRRQEAAREEEQRQAEEQDRRKAPWAMRPPSEFGCGNTRSLPAPLGCPGWLCAGRPPCKQGSVFAFAVVGVLPPSSLAARRPATL
ncbi:uncharacterized protein LOC128898531 [Dryobates pubescens]|uniref:uncharacterized protein LOC128898531 n=1 Tax=Dryobates pubescens TaxID=118200 RepID=UPI0023B8AC8F|nr:uncharacterized protein LOC128898531 [Dryobates pubescens]